MPFINFSATDLDLKLGLLIVETRTMDSNRKSMPSFFKVLISADFNRQLRLPLAFVKEWGEILPQFLAQIRTSSGKMWHVKLEKREDQNYYFTGGWANFCEDLGLAIGEFVVFWYCGKITFDVAVYGMNGCERKIAAIYNPIDGSDPEDAVNNRTPVVEDLDVKIKIEDEDGIDPRDESDDGTIKRYSKKLDHRNSTRLDIPKAFVLSAGIGGDRTIHLQDSKTRLWPVQMTSSPRKRGGSRYALTAGWNDFLVGNKVAIGNTVLLKCEVPGGSLVKAKVLDNGTKGQFFQARGKHLKLRPTHDPSDRTCKEECVFF